MCLNTVKGIVKNNFDEIVAGNAMKYASCVDGGGNMNFNNVKQFIEDGQGLKEWLEAQGAKFKEDSQPTLIGALWYRENEIEVGSNWDAYFAAPMTTIEGNSANKVLKSTTAKELIVEDIILVPTALPLGCDPVGKRLISDAYGRNEVSVLIEELNLLV